MDLAEFKDYLIEQIGYQADWRDEKASEYPQDDRNKNSARALRALASQLAEVPATHPKLHEAWRFFNGLRKPDDPDDSLRGIEVEHEVLRQYGFYDHKIGDPEDFLTEYLKALRDSVWSED